MLGQRLYFLLEILFDLSLDILRKRQNIIKSKHKKGEHLWGDFLIYTWILFKIHFRCFPWYHGKNLVSEIFENLEVSLSWVAKWHIRHHGHYVLFTNNSIKVKIEPFTKIIVLDEFEIGSHLHIERKLKHFIYISNEHSLKISYKCSRVDTFFIELDKLPLLFWKYDIEPIIDYPR